MHTPVQICLKKQASIRPLDDIRGLHHATTSLTDPAVKARIIKIHMSDMDLSQN